MKDKMQRTPTPWVSKRDYKPTCNACNGSGRWSDYDICEKCDGRGKLRSFNEQSELNQLLIEIAQAEAQ